MGTTPASDASHDHESGDEHHDPNSKSTSVKDKECPFCHQHFTSSSLGRHLDQFITKKKPDGLHDVDGIRKLRSGITRRTARGSKKEAEDNDSVNPSPAPVATHVQSITPSSDSLNKAHSSATNLHINRYNWTSTGVITDPSALTSPAHVQSPMITSPSGKKRSFSTFATEIDPSTTADTARALELSLREVLDALRAANAHVAPQPSPFTFDIQSQTYPGLCIQMLPTPPTLFQPSPFQTLDTVSINAPGPDQFQPLRKKIISTIDTWKWNSLRLAQPTTSNIADEAAFLTRSAAEYTESALSHLDICYQNWMAHPAEIRAAIWDMELLRAYKTEHDRTKRLEERLEQVQQEANQLQQQVEYLSRCQWPREMALWPPDRHTFDKSMREELRLINLTRMGGVSNNSNTHSGNERDSTSGGSGGAGGGGHDSADRLAATENINRHGGGDKWDFDRLVNKWKSHVKEDKVRRQPFVHAMAGRADHSSPGHHHALKDESAGGISRTGTPLTASLYKSRSDGDMGINGNTPNTTGPGGSGGGGSLAAVVNGGLYPGDDGKRKIGRVQKNISIVSDF